MTAIYHPKTKLQEALQGDRQYRNLVDRAFRLQRPFIEENISSYVIKFQDTRTQELLAGKILLPSGISVRDYTSRSKRHACLRECAERNFKFAPEGVCIGLRPVLFTEGDTVYCGAIADPDGLDERFEYIWFMYLLKAGESIEAKVQRNVAILEPLAHAMHTVHLRADTVDVEEAWRFARQDVQQEKLLREIALFESALTLLCASVPREEWQALWPDACSEHLRGVAAKIGKSEICKRAFERRIEGGYIKKGHGDIKLKNIWFSDYYRLNPVRKFEDCLTFFDAIDFNDTFSIIDTLNETAMLAVDLQRTAAPVDYARFLYFYTEPLGRQWHVYDELVFAYYTMVKALVNTHVAVLLDGDYDKARDYLWLLRVLLKRWMQQMERLESRTATLATVR